MFYDKANDDWSLPLIWQTMFQGLAVAVIKVELKESF